MKIKFKDGAVKTCTQPVEQKIFKGSNAAGWLLSVSISDSEITSDSIDELVTAENISQLTLLDDEMKELYSIGGYNELASAIIRHSESEAKADLQLKKIIPEAGADNEVI